MKRPALQNERVGDLGTAFRARKSLVSAETVVLRRWDVKHENVVHQTNRVTKCGTILNYHEFK